jgi:translation initiation factor IF-3
MVSLQPLLFLTCLSFCLLTNPFPFASYINQQSHQLISSQLFSTLPPGRSNLYNRGTGGKEPAKPPPPINQYIRADNVRLILPGNTSTDADVMVGIVTLGEALAYAERLQVDLVMINDKGDPPVCKAIDYGKYKYSLEKKKKESIKKQVHSEVKEIKMSHKIEQHDFEVRVKAIQKFLSEGDRVSKIKFIT